MLEEGGRGDHSWAEFIPILTGRAIYKISCRYGERVRDVSISCIIIIVLTHKVVGSIILSDNAVHISLPRVFEHTCHQQEI
jgi:hypothetical protein